MKPYSMDLRTRVVADRDGGMTTKAVAAKYAVSPSWVRRVKQVHRETGRVAPVDQAHGPAATWVAHAEAIREAVRQAPDATLDEYRTRFALPLSRSVLARALAALSLSRKKVGPGG
jgi:transposase